jgi:DNA (cytosine-5)-methyltransferase 1
MVVGYDMDPECKYPYSANNDAEFRLTDVTNLKPMNIKKSLPRGPYRLIAGCAPCQAFSTYTQGFRHSARWRLLERGLTS